MRKGDPLTVIAASGKAAGEFPWMYSMFSWFGSLWQTPLAPLLRWFSSSVIDITIAMGDFSGTFWSIPPNNADIWGLDAETGKTLWKWNKAPWVRGNFRGEQVRVRNGVGFC